MDLYLWNLEISAAFYPSLNGLEVTLRNALHSRLGALFGRPDWWTAAPLRPNGTRMVSQAEEKLRSRSVTLTADNIVTELSFGFWVSLVSNTYHRNLWSRGLHRSFPHFRGARADLYTDLRRALILRNRIMHHEPIHSYHLQAYHATIYRLIRYLSPDMASCLSACDRVTTALTGRSQP
jgi:hypothetical protein